MAITRSSSDAPTLNDRGQGPAIQPERGPTWGSGAPGAASTTLASTWPDADPASRQRLQRVSDGPVTCSSVGDRGEHQVVPPFFSSEPLTMNRIPATSR